MRAGDVLAVIDSADLAAAKLDYYSAVTELGCCQFDLPRAQAINDNVLKMLELLESSPSVEQLQEAAPGVMGDYRSRLISTYAEYVVSRKAYERERTLMAKKISSEGDFLAAESVFKKAQAGYHGARDSVAFEVSQNVLEKTVERQLFEFQAETAKQKLYMLGLAPDDVAVLASAQPVLGAFDKANDHECTDPNCEDCADHAEPAGSHVEATLATFAGAGDHACTDPNCEDCADHAAPAGSQNDTARGFNHANLGWYEIKAPFEGVIVERHITLGERVGADSDVFTIVDTSSVWVNLTVYTRNLAAIRRLQDVVLRVDHSGAQARGTRRLGYAVRRWRDAICDCPSCAGQPRWPLDARYLCDRLHQQLGR